MICVPPFIIDIQIINQTENWLFGTSYFYPCAVCARVMRLCPSMCVCVCICVSYACLRLTVQNSKSNLFTALVYVSQRCCDVSEASRSFCDMSSNLFWRCSGVSQLLRVASWTRSSSNLFWLFSSCSSFRLSAAAAESFLFRASRLVSL